MSLASASAASWSTPWKIPLRASTSSIAYRLLAPEVKPAAGLHRQSRHTGAGIGPPLACVGCTDVSGPTTALVNREEAGRSLPVLVWRFPRPALCLASGPL